MTWHARLVVALLLLAGACGGPSDEPETVTGRVTTRTAEEVCVSRDPRLAESDCVQVDDLAEDVDLDDLEVGACASITTQVASTGAAVRVEPASEAACAAGDLGDGNDD